MRTAARRTVAAAAAALSLLPIAVAWITWRGRWMPTSDWASVVIRSYDTFSSHPPLVGIYSSATTSAGGTHNVYHPGPLQEWLLAVPIHLLAPSTAGILFGSAVLVSVTLATALTVAWRRGGPGGTAVATVALALFVWGTGPTMLVQPLHTWLGTYAMVAFCACVWAVLDGDGWFWPVAVFFGSLAGQAQVAFLVPVVVLVAVAFVSAFARRSAVDGPAAPAARVALVTAVTAAACWAAPLYDQFFGTGNLWALISTGSDGSPVGPLWALRNLAGTLAVPPSWIDHDQHLSITVLSGGRVIWHTDAWTWITAALVGVAICAGLWRARRVRDRTRTTLGVTTVAALAGCFVASMLMPDEPFSLLGHREVWRAAGLFAWGFVAIAVFDTVATAVPGLTTRLDRRAPQVAGLFAVAAVIAVSAVTVGRANPAGESGSIGFGSVEAFTAAASPRCVKGPVVVRPTTLVDAPTALGLIAMLELRGCEVHAENLGAILPGPAHRVTGDEPTTLAIDGFPGPPPGCRQIGFYDPAHPPPHYRGYSHGLARLQREGPLYLFECV